MKNLAIALLSMWILHACDYKGELPEKVRLKINLTGLEFNPVQNDTLKLAHVDFFSEFVHSYAQTEINLYREGASYHFSVGAIGEGISTTLTVGEYSLDCYGGWASPFGMAEMSFFVPGRPVKIGSSTVALDLAGNPDCALILVSDIQDLLETAYIEGAGNPGVSFARQGNYWYSYFLPSQDFRAHIVKKSGAEQIINTAELLNGQVYQVVIAMAP